MALSATKKVQHLHRRGRRRATAICNDATKIFSHCEHFVPHRTEIVKPKLLHNSLVFPKPDFFRIDRLPHTSARSLVCAGNLVLPLGQIFHFETQSYSAITSNEGILIQGANHLACRTENIVCILDAKDCVRATNTAARHEKVMFYGMPSFSCS